MANKFPEKLRKFGYDDFFESNREGGFSVARVIVEHKGMYRVINEKGEFSAKITGKRMFIASSREDFPAVGDWVEIVELDGENAVIHKILPRRTVIKRKYGDRSKAGGKKEIQIIATNVDVAFVVQSCGGRDFNLNRFERYFSLVRDGGVEPAIILNKTDLISKEELDLKLAEIKNRFGDIKVVSTSVVGDQGLAELNKAILPGKTYCFLGSSGVGKSSLINKLIGGNFIKTADISSYSGRGKHVTTNREMYFLPALRSLGEGVTGGGIVIDNPGMREVGMGDTGTGIDSVFDEIATLAKNCKYADCGHVHEPGCAVLAALKSGKLDEGKYHNYISLKEETEYCEMSLFEKREKDKNFGKFVKKAKKELKNTKNPKRMLGKDL